MIPFWLSIVIAFSVCGFILTIFLCGLLDIYRQSVRRGTSKPRAYIRWIYSTRPVDSRRRAPHSRLGGFSSHINTYEAHGMDLEARRSVDTLPRYEELPPAYMKVEVV
jgi:hypothetical protein